jgi:hypothetical protein
MVKKAALHTLQKTWEVIRGVPEQIVHNIEIETGLSRNNNISFDTFRSRINSGNMSATNS